MKIGIIGAGQIGGTLTRRFTALGHEVFVASFRPIRIRARHVSMFQLFVAPTAFEGWGEHDYDGTAERQLLAMLIVVVGALALILCVALLMLFADQPAGPHAQLPDTGLFIFFRGVAGHPSRPCTHK